MPEFRCPNFFRCLSLPIEVIDQPKKVPKKSGAHGFFGSGEKLTLLDGFANLAEKTWEIQNFFLLNLPYILGLLMVIVRIFCPTNPHGAGASHVSDPKLP